MYEKQEHRKASGKEKCVQIFDERVIAMQNNLRHEQLAVFRVPDE